MAVEGQNASVRRQLEGLNTTFMVPSHIAGPLLTCTLVAYYYKGCVIIIIQAAVEVLYIQVDLVRLHSRHI